MKRNFKSILFAVLIAVLAISPAYAGGVKVSFGLGSITVNGEAFGFGKDAVISVYAEGVPLVACGAPGSNNLAQGQNPPRLSAFDSQPATDAWLGKGRFGVNLEAEANYSGYTPSELGCANDNWHAAVVFVFWDTATITVVNAKGDVTYQQAYRCTTTYIPNNNPNDTNTLDNGTISCTPM